MIWTTSVSTNKLSESLSNIVTTVGGVTSHLITYTPHWGSVESVKRDPTLKEFGSLAIFSTHHSEMS